MSARNGISSFYIRADGAMYEFNYEFNPDSKYALSDSISLTPPGYTPCHPDAPSETFLILHRTLKWFFMIENKKEFDKKIPREEIQKYSKLIDKVAAGNLIKSEVVGAYDVGTTCYFAFQPVADSGQIINLDFYYRGYLLDRYSGGGSDFRHNTSEAEIIIDWLRDRWSE